MSPSRIACPALLLLAACAPTVTHGPRVEPGPSLYLTAGLPRALCGAQRASRCEAGLIPTLGVGAHYGFVPGDPSRPSFLAGVDLPALDPASAELEGFVQLPSPGVWTGGAGVLSSVRHVMPYAQAGRMRAGTGRGWYASLAYARLFQNPDFGIRSTTPGSFMARPPRYWSPGGGIRLNSRRGRYTLFANAAFGSWIEGLEHYPPATGPDQPVVSDTTFQRRSVRTLLLGVTWETPFSQLRFPRLPPARIPTVIP